MTTPGPVEIDSSHGHLIPVAMLPDGPAVEDGSPVVFVSTLTPHTRHLHRDPRASVLLAEEVADGADRLAAARVGVMGTMELLPRGSDAFASARERYLAAHPSAICVDHVDALRDCARALIAGFPPTT